MFGTSTVIKQTTIHDFGTIEMLISSYHKSFYDHLMIKN